MQHNLVRRALAVEQYGWLSGHLAMIEPPIIGSTVDLSATPSEG